MVKLRDILKKNWFYVGAFLVPWFAMIIHCLLANIWITGDGALYTGDLLVQIIPLMNELWDAVHTGEALVYSWNLAGGIDFFAIWGYFISPFTLILLAVPKEWIPEVMNIIMVLKWSLTAVSATYFFVHTKHNKIKEHRNSIAMMLGVAFCLSNAMVCYIKYIQFQDVLICFPFLLLLVEKLVDEKRWKLYYLLLSACIISNSYITFEICIFLVVWFVLQFNHTTKERFKKFLIFAGMSILSALTSVCIVLPSYLVAQNRLQNTDNGRTLGYAQSILIKFSTFIKQFFIFENVASAVEIQPNVYCSIIVVLLACLFLFVKMDGKRKLYMLAVTIFFCASFFIGYISLVWHLLNIPNGVYHRFAPFFVMWVLFLAMHTIADLDKIRIRYILLSFLVIMGLFLYAFFRIENYSTVFTYLLTILLIVLYFMLFFFHRRKSIQYKNMLLLIVLFGLGELFLNAQYSLQEYNGIAYYKEDGEFTEAMELLEEITMKDGERVSASAPCSNLNLCVGVPNASGFISAINGEMLYFYERLGMAYSGSVEYSARGASPLLNLMLNIRYGMDTSEMVYSDATLIAENDIVQLYRTKRLAGLGYMVPDDVLEWDVATKHCFNVQNQFVELTTGEKAIFTDVKPDVECVDTNGEEVERDNAYEGLGSFVYNMERETGTVYDSIQLEFEVESDMDLYMFSCADRYYKMCIIVDDKIVHADYKSYSQSTYHIGKVQKGQKITVVAIPDVENETGDERLLFRFAEFHEENYAKAYEKLSKNVYEIEEMDSEHVKGKIYAEEVGIMMTSIQAVDGFTVFVDGEKMDYKTIGRALIGVPLEAGEHTVEFKYKTPYLNLAMGITAGAFAIFILLCIIDWKRMKKQSVFEEAEELEDITNKDIEAE